MSDMAARRVLALAQSLGGPLLGLDTSTATTSLCLALPGTDSVFESSLSAASLPSESLVEGLAALFSQAHISPKDLHAAVVGIGPGSFTGLRVGLATIKGLALGTGVPVYGVSSLAVMAASVGPGLVAPLCDARRGEWYAALYNVPTDGGAATVMDDVIVAPERAVETLRQHGQGMPLILVGDVAAIAATQLTGVTAQIVSAPMRMVHGLLLAEAAMRAKCAEPLAHLVPRYMRVSEAERQLEKRTAGGGTRFI